MHSFKVWAATVLLVANTSACSMLAPIDYSNLDDSQSCQPVNDALPTTADTAESFVLAPNQSFTNTEHMAAVVESSLSATARGRTIVTSVIGSDRPKLIASGVVDLSDKVFGSNSTRELSGMVSGVLEMATCNEGIDKQNPDLDLVQAIATAASSIASTKVAGFKEIVVVSNGLQTAGDFDLSRSFAVTPQEIVASLQRANALPNLDGLSVKFVGIGETADEYPALPTSSRSHLEGIWSAIVEAANGTYINGGPLGIDGSNADGAAIKAVAPLPVGPIVSQCKASLTDENLAFSPDSSAFLDLASATASIEDLIAKIGHNDCGFHYEIVGYTTNFGSSEHQISLSLARAEAVAKLVREKYPQANVSVSGMGYDGTGGLSQSNRRVEVTVTK